MPKHASTDRAALVGAIVDLAERAGRIILDVYASDFEVAAKDDASPVTLADTRSEETILAGLESIAPGVPTVAEEAFAAGRADTVASTFFLVDPLDGTREFVGRNGEFTVNIALIEDGVPVLGVVHAPALSRMFFAGAAGEACEKSTQDGSRRPVAARRPPRSGPVAIASRSHRDAATDAYLDALGIEETKAAGSSLKFCLVAAGEADLYPRFGPTCEWDTAAGHAILLHAGGHLCRLDGEPFGYGKVAERFLNPGFLAWGAGPRPPLPDAGPAAASQPE